MGVAEFRQARALGVFGHTRFEADRAHRIGAASRRSHRCLRRNDRVQRRYSPRLAASTLPRSPRR